MPDALDVVEYSEKILQQQPFIGIRFFSGVLQIFHASSQYGSVLFTVLHQLGPELSSPLRLQFLYRQEYTVAFVHKLSQCRVKKYYLLSEEVYFGFAGSKVAGLVYE